MRFFLDANMPRAAVGALTALGHEVEFCRDVGMANERDEEVATRARQTQAALATRDLDFADIRWYPPEQYFGIVVIRLPDDAIAPDIVNVLVRFAGDSHFTTNLAGRLAIVDQNRVRFRPPLS
jgi:predicted nuclease of predicted toxin-antitoxin system